MIANEMVMFLHCKTKGARSARPKDDRGTKYNSN